MSDKDRLEQDYRESDAELKQFLSTLPTDDTELYGHSYTWADGRYMTIDQHLVYGDLLWKRGQAKKALLRAVSP